MQATGTPPAVIKMGVIKERDGVNVTTGHDTATL